MSKRLQPAKAKRALALLTALTCFWLSTVGSIFHNHGIVNGLDETQTVAKRATTGSPLSIAKAQQSIGDPGQCAACEWQANSVSVALPVFSVPQPPILTAPAVALTSSYVKLLTSQSPSRAPPVV